MINMKNPNVTNSTTPFKVSKNETDDLTPEQLIAEANAMVEKAKEMNLQAQKAAAEKLERDRSYDMETLDNLRKEVAKLEFVEKGTHDPDRRGELYSKISKYKADIDEIELKYGLKPTEENTVPAMLEETVSSTGILMTTLKIASLLIICWGIVLYSGDWIIAKYPNAAIYNEVSFQKVLFGFSVFIGAFVSVIIALNVFFPGFGKYFNPFNNNSLDFFDDFKTLSSWQRNVISLFLFFCLLFAFVLIAGGKLD